MKPGDLHLKDPDAEYALGADWTAYLAGLGDDVQIDTSEWFITSSESPVGLELGADEIEDGGLRTNAVLPGGSLSRKYTVTNRIVTDSNPAVTDDRSFFVKVVQR